MRSQLLIYLFFAFMVCSISAQTGNFIVNTQQLSTLQHASRNYFYDLNEPGSMGCFPWIDGRGLVSVVNQDGILHQISLMDTPVSKQKVNTKPYRENYSRVESPEICILQTKFKIYFFRIYDTYTDNEVPSFGKSVILAYHNLLLVGDRPNSGMIYSGYLFAKNGTYKLLNDSEVRAYLISQSSAFSYSNEKLFYGDVNLLLSPMDGFDDDGNIYSARTVYYPTGGSITIEPIEKNRDRMFDYEGNFWQIAYTNDQKMNPILYYQGREWGYPDPPQKARVNDDGLRVRLRASADAYILGTLKKGQPISVLKTGVKQTISNITAPWYRIKTAEGLIGWAFGGYIELVR